ncbi:hypothetical protein BH09BAC4_BH09BAC4_37670 [soil metagenome]
MQTTAHFTYIHETITVEYKSPTAGTQPLV